MTTAQQVTNLETLKQTLTAKGINFETNLVTYYEFSKDTVDRISIQLNKNKWVTFHAMSREGGRTFYDFQQVYNWNTGEIERGIMTGINARTRVMKMTGLTL